MSKVATNFRHEGGEIVQQYHETIVTREGIDAQGKYVQCFNGGWQTNTTKRRINDRLEFVGWAIFQKAGAWYVWNQETGESVPFKEGIILRPVRIPETVEVA